MISLIRGSAASVLSLVLVAAMLMPAGAQAAEPVDIAPACPDDAPDAFGDDDGSVHAAAIDCIAALGVTSGTGDGYAPAGSVVRAQMATFIVHLLMVAGHEFPDSVPDAFTDDDESPHAANIDRLVDAGVVGGYGDGTYRPAEPVTRGQMATFILEAVDAVTGAVPQDAANAFPDDDGTTHEPSIDAIASLGLVVGTPEGTYVPAGLVRRDQMASYLARAAAHLAAAGHWPEPEVLGAIIELVQPGGSVSPDGGADGVGVTVTSPNAGLVTIQRGQTATADPVGFVLLDIEVDITAPAASPDQPLILDFRLGPDLVPDGTEASEVSLYRDGTVVPDCTATSAVADPDPCVAERLELADGGVRLTARTSQASTWNFGIPAPSGGGGGGGVVTPPQNDAPTVEPVDDRTDTVGATVELQVVADDVDGDALSYSATGLPGGLSIDADDGVISGTITADPDSYEVTVTVDDGDATTDVSFTWSVTAEPNDPPTAGDDTATTDEDTSVSIDVLDNDADADGDPDPATVEVVTGPSNGTVVHIDPGTGAVTYVPDADFNGSDAFTYTVDDDDGETSNEATVTITVEAVNDAPTVDAIDDRTDTVGDTVELQVVADDVDGDALSYSATGLPGGLSIDADDGVISGTITADPDSYEVTVTVDDGDATTEVSFAWTVAADVSQGAATVAIDPGPAMDASTFNGGFLISNTGDVAITSVTYDLSTAVLPDMVLDPVGTAGDAAGKCVDPVSGATATGYDTPDDPCTDPFSGAREGGYDAVTVTFDDFEGGESFEFAVDVDPTTIKEHAGTGNAGSVSGLELTGTTITVEYADGTVVAETYRVPGSDGGSQVVAVADQPDTPTIDAVGVEEQPTTFSDADGSHTAASVTDPEQTITVEGPSGAEAKLLHLDASRVQMSNPEDPSWEPFDPEEYEANIVVAIQEYDVTIGPDGTVDVPVTLTDTGGETAPNESGLNHFVAVVVDGSTTSATSNVVILRLDAANQPPVAVDDTATVEVGGSVVIDVLANDSDPDGTIDPTTVDITSGPSGGTATVDGETGEVTYNAEQGFEDSGSDTFAYTVDDDDGATSAPATVTVTLPSETIALYRINAGGPEYTDVDGNLWEADAASGYFTGGQLYDTDEPIDGTEDDALYQTERYGDPFSYAFPVSDGTYTVDLHLAEIYVGVASGDGSDLGEGDRLFDVTLEGTTVLDDYDLYADVGALTATVQSFDVDVTDGTLDIGFSASVDNAKISAIEIRGAAVPDELGASPGTVDFGAVTVGDTASETVTVSNPGASTDQIEISEITIGGDAAFGLSQIPTLPLTLQPGDSETFEISFAPDDATPGSATVSVTHTGENSPLEVPVAGTGEDAPAGGDTLHRVNAGGPAIGATDGGPDWTADTESSPSSYLADEGSNDTSIHGTVGSVDGTVPASTPGGVFTTERWDNAEGTEMAWSFPVASGTNVEVRLYLRNGYDGTSQVGERVFDVVLEGATVLDDYDIVGDVGHDVGTMKSFVVTSDGAIDLEFLHVTENPLVNAIEIVVDEPRPNELGTSSTTVDFGQVLIGNTAEDTLTVTNLGDTGDPDITIGAVAVTGDADDEFAASLVGDATIAPGETRTIDVTFSPADAGSGSATLEISHTGDGSPASIALQGEGSSGIDPSFGSTGLSGEASNNPTSLEFGPDGRLYVAQQDGTIQVYTVERVASSDYQVAATETIDLVKDIPNHDDDGSSSSTTGRQVTGLMTAGTAENPVLYVTSSDPRIAGGGGGTDAGLDTNSGILSRLTWDGADWEHVQLVRGLPRSEENHSTNGLDLDPATNVLYVMSGGHTNKGAPSNNFAGTPEYALSAAMLSIDLDAIGAMPVQTDDAGQSYVYDLPTLDDPTRANTSGGSDPGDPFGGNNGLNQARIVSGGPVQVYSPGYRNAYDVVFTESGRLYTWDNGPNGGWGGLPVDEGPTGVCTNEFNEDGSTGYGDGLHHVTGPDYYGGHPNPTRANPDSGLYVYEYDGGSWTATSTHAWSDFPEPPVPDGQHNDVECDYLVPGVEDGTQVLIGSSTNGLAEYTASNFGGELQGDLLVASFNGNVYRVQLDAGGDTTSHSSLFSGFGSTPLDVTTQGDGDPFPGTIWVAAYGSDDIVVFEPVDYDGGSGGTCTGDDDEGLDEDGDGYSNADEIDNGTDPCSAGSQPPDWDDDGLSDLNDTDDDNDGIPDVDDAFALDPGNGMTTSLPVERPLFNNDPGTGFFGLGFTGLMTNGETDYLDQFDETALAAGGTSGLLTVEQVTGGDAYQDTDTQDNAFQYGVDADTGSDPFVVHGQLETPYFEGMSTPEDYQSAGIFIGTGDQDNYLKVVMNANGGNGGVEVLLEDTGSATSTQYDPDVVGDILASSQVDLYLAVDPAAGTAQPRVSLDGGTTLVDLGAPLTLPAGWLDPSDDQGLAVGVISTANPSDGSVDPFGATWDFLNVETADTAASTAQAGVEITPDGGIDASTYGSGSYTITNDSGDGQLIESVSFDLSTALLPDLVFDPDGTAGDQTAKCLVADSGAADTGYDSSGDPCADPFSVPHNGTDAEDGYDVATATFDDFGPGETFAFSVDNDPTSIKGEEAPGPNESGSVSGLELVGATVTVTFSDGTEATTSIFSDGSDGGGVATAAAGLPDAPGISIDGVATPATVADAAQTVTLTGPVGATVRLLRAEAGLFLPDGGGYDVEAFEANSAVDVELLGDVDLGSDGSAEIDVTLTRADDDSGLNHLVAVVVDNADRTGATSDVVVVEYDPGATSSSVVHRLNAGGDLIAAGDGGPDWEADADGAASAYLAAGGDSVYGSSDAITFDASVPSGVPEAVFQIERYDTTDSAEEMLYSFPVDDGDYEVRIYLAELFLTSGDSDSRVFDIAVEGSVPSSMQDIDQLEDHGHDVGFMLTTTVTVGDGTIDIEFLRDLENPAVKGFEILDIG